MDWFLYDRDFPHEQVKVFNPFDASDLCYPPCTPTSSFFMFSGGMERD